MGIIFSILLIALLVMIGLLFLRVLAFGIGVGIVLALVGLAGITLVGVSFGGPLTIIIYLMIKIFMILFIVGLVAGIVMLIKNTLAANNS
ncbi:MAG TPA: hypothetical protein VM577_10415 [Anaerovoracaceae bacterium]|nr:hypothetical protein [Anaerovoracaceae bacterium]